ncbi:MAG: hypothetical protein AB7R89_26205 [Dehalococcoidia bacterium]
MTTEQWCSRCQSRQAMEWQADDRFGHSAESACCPRCGGIWGVRSRRVPYHEPAPSTSNDDAGSVSPVTRDAHTAPIEGEKRPAGGR